MSSETTVKATRTIPPRSRGGFTFGPDIRWMCTHITNRRMIGTAMCRNTSSVKKRSDRLEGSRKLRAIGSPKIGIQSRSSVEVVATYCASLSQTSQYPVTPQT